MARAKNHDYSNNETTSPPTLIISTTYHTLDGGPTKRDLVFGYNGNDPQYREMGAQVGIPVKGSMQAHE